MSLLRLPLLRSFNILAKNPSESLKFINKCRNNTILKPSLANIGIDNKFFSLSSQHRCQEIADDNPPKIRKYDKPGRDRSTVIPVETSIEYLASSEYKETYGDKFIWEGYRRVHKGGIPPKKTRESCIRFRVITTSSPCPICRDEYLILDYKNLELLKQFISPHTGEVSPFCLLQLLKKTLSVR